MSWLLAFCCLLFFVLGVVVVLACPYVLVRAGCQEEPEKELEKVIDTRALARAVNEYMTDEALKTELVNGCSISVKGKLNLVKFAEFIADNLTWKPSHKLFTREELQIRRD